LNGGRTHAHFLFFVKIHQRMTWEEQYHELAFYTLSHKGSQFIHQHVVDAFAAQTADAHTKPITLVYALAGLYLLNEKDYTGKEVQQAHVLMSKGSKVFPSLTYQLKGERSPLLMFYMHRQELREMH
jgi:hypothetical protein